MYVRPARASDPEYLKLEEEVTARGLLKKTPLIHFLVFLFCIVLLAGGFYALSFTQNVIVVFISAVLLAFPRLWIAYVGHDISHGEVFHSNRVAYVAELIVWNLLSGIRASSWERNHNKHHIYTNIVGKDPDTIMPFIFSSKQEEGIGFVWQYIPSFRKYQHIWFFIVVPIVYAGRMFKTRTKEYTETRLWHSIELFLVFVNLALLAFVVFSVMNFWNGVLFLFVNSAVVAFLSSFVFAPNHKGEYMLLPGEEMTWRMQVKTTRNITPSLFVDFFYGGLNYQVEHHLFPHISRFRLPHAHSFIKQFCEAHGLSYNETTPLGSLKEMYLSLKENSVPV